MSRSLSGPQPAAKTELETVVNWPLVVSAAGLTVVVLTVTVVLACFAAAKGKSVKDPIASLPAAPQTKPVNVEPRRDSPRKPVLPVGLDESIEKPSPLQVYVKAVPPPIPPDPTPIPKAIKTPPADPSARNPIVQAPVTKAPDYKTFEEIPEAHDIHQLVRGAKDVDLESVPGTREKILKTGHEEKENSKPAILAVCAKRPDLRGLPLREGADYQAPSEAVLKMQRISTTLRRRFDRPRMSASGTTPASVGRGEVLQHLLQSSTDWFQEDGVSTLVQMLQVEDDGSRNVFVKRLAKIAGARASALLAHRALFDLSLTVRKEAIRALKDRPRQEYRQVLLEGLRYPWPPVAAHAAEALAALNDRDSLFRLTTLLDEPDPCAPRREKNNKWVIAEVVRVNHLRNCLLCHAPSSSDKDPMRAVVPTPGQPLPPGYSARGKGSFVRADITYLRQDFSLMEFVAKPDKWPQWQRFDYLVRTRELTAEELADYDRICRSDGASYPQRKAVLFALRELTGQDLGECSANWRDFLYTLASSPEP
jgi:hypothetical protein